MNKNEKMVKIDSVKTAKFLEHNELIRTGKRKRKWKRKKENIKALQDFHRRKTLKPYRTFTGEIFCEQLNKINPK